MAKSESRILAEVFESTRQLTRYYSSNLKGVDMMKEFKVEGNVINSPYWLIGHLVWSEQYLLIKALGGADLNIPWIGHFGFGSKLPEDTNGLPTIKEIFDTWKEVHQAATDRLNSLKDEELDETNDLGISFGGDNSKRLIIHHVIRHEAIHAGHLGLIAKMHGIQTV